MRVLAWLGRLLDADRAREQRARAYLDGPADLRDAYLAGLDDGIRAAPWLR